MADDASGDIVDVDRLDVDKGPLRVDGLDEGDGLVGCFDAEVAAPRPGRVDLARHVWQLLLHQLDQLVGARLEDGSLLARLDDETDTGTGTGGGQWLRRSSGTKREALDQLGLSSRHGQAGGTQLLLQLDDRAAAEVWRGAHQAARAARRVRRRRAAQREASREPREHVEQLLAARRDVSDKRRALLATVT